RDEVVERGRAHSALTGYTADRLGREVMDDTLMAAPHQAAHHVRSHAPETDHADLHLCLHLEGSTRNRRRAKRRGGDSNSRTLAGRRFSRPVVSAAHPPLRTNEIDRLACQLLSA